MGRIIVILMAIPATQWISIGLGLVSLGRELMKHIGRESFTPKEKARKLAALRRGIQRFEKNGDTEDIEGALADIGICLGLRGDKTDR